MFRLVITCEKSPGILSQITVMSRRVGLEIDNQDVDDSSENRIFSLDLDTSKDKIKPLYQQIKTISGVKSIKAYEIKQNNDSSSDAGNSGYISKIINDFPNIKEAVLVTRAELDTEEVEEGMFHIGLKVASSRINNNDIDLTTDDKSLSGIMDNVMLPELAKLSSAEYVKEGYETGLMIANSVFTKPNADEKSSSVGNTFGSLESNTVRCDFLTGYIAGVVNAVAFHEGKTYNINETRCRNEGHPYCLFVLEE